MAVIKAAMVFDLDFCPPHTGLEQRIFGGEISSAVVWWRRFWSTLTSV